jgi:heptaprenyl diphosphate synthase
VTPTARFSLRDRLTGVPALKGLAAEVEAGVPVIEAEIARNVTFADDVADATGRYLLDAGGKRMRPTLAIITAQLGDGLTDDVTLAAAAIELTHLASLYHDDVMDEAPLRRGVPSAHIVWGNSVAILTGDLLFSRASTMMSRLGERAMALQAETFERLCIGQMHETVGPQPGEDAIAHYLRVLSDKTGSLISAAARAGVRYANGPEEYEAPLVNFGEKIGVAFQLADDGIDLAPAADSTGKKAGTDLRAGVPTLPTLLLAQAAISDPEARALQERIARAASEDGTDADLESVTAELFAHPVTQATRDEARRWAAEAMDGLEALPSGPVRTALNLFAEHVVARTD